MPYKTRRPCRHIGCPRYAGPSGYCGEHISESIRKDDRRLNANDRGYDARWRQARKLFLGRNPLCRECMKAGRLTPATVVDHIIPHRGDQKLFWDESNWQPLCKACHDKKTGSGL